jgi:hypothetical protein
MWEDFEDTTQLLDITLKIFQYDVVNLCLLLSAVFGLSLHVTRSLVLCVCFVDCCLSFCLFLVCPLRCLFFFNLRILITPWYLQNLLTYKLTTSYWNIFNVISNSCVHQSFCWTASVSRWCNGYSGVQCIMSSISGLVKPKTMKLIVAASLLIKKY